MKKSLLILLAILVVAAGLRLYKLGSVPVSPDWDEAALGYNAYSILKTGRDEYGTRLPLTLRSFDDYKPPLYVYLTVPSVAAFGVSVFATRLPSAVMGVLAVLGTYFLARELLRDKKNDTVPLVAAFLLAISPWHIQVSRVAFETNVGDSVTIWAVTTFLVGLRKRMLLPVSALLFGLGMYSYHSERVFLPLMLLLLIVSQWKRLFTKENRIALFTSVVIGLIFAVPLIPILFGENGLLRLKATSTFTDTTNLLVRDIPKLERDQKAGDVLGLILDNRRVVYVKTLIWGYLSHYSPEWLFLTSDNPRHHAPDMGLMYVWEIPFLLFGLFVAWKNLKGWPRILLFGWFLLAPVPAAPTTGLPHAIRTLNFLPTHQIFTALGIVAVVSALVRKRGFFALAAVYTIFILFNFAYYLDMYFVQQNPENSQYWQYGYRDAVALTEKLKPNYQKIVVSTTLDQSYMFFLFYTKYDPALYLAHGGTKSGSFEEVRNSFDKYEFRKIVWSQEKRDGTVLYVGDPKDMPHGNVGNIKFLNGTPAIELADRPNGAE